MSTEALGYTGAVLHVELDGGGLRVEHPEPAFYRMYLGGSALGGYYLARDCPLEDADPLGPENVLVVAPSVTTGAMVSGASRVGVLALSPVTGGVADGQAGGAFGPYLKRSGFDAVVLHGRAPELSVLVLEGGEARLLPVPELRGMDTERFRQELLARLPGGRWSIMQCGPAGERLVRYACLLVDEDDAVGRGGLGAVFGSKNLRAIAVSGEGGVRFADPAELRRLARLAASRVVEGSFPAVLRKYGTTGIIDFQSGAGNMATRNHSAGWDERIHALDGSAFLDELGAGGRSCPGCAVNCRKRVRLGDHTHAAPEFETLSLLGSNVGIFDPEVVARANELCSLYGLDTIAAGGLVAWVFELAERGLLDPSHGVRGFGDADALLRLLRELGEGEGLGGLLGQGFRRAAEQLGPGTLRYAVQVKDQALAAHLPQVKPSLAVIYAASPIGPDHMSSEHDWLLASESDYSLGLGIVGHGDAASTGLPKLRMAVYSQYFYSLLDSLTLCMFVFGPGSLLDYRDLEDLVRAATGWKVTLWELLKVGERRVNLLRQINARRGLGREQDRLPPRLFEPIPEGPSEGRRVDPGRFPTLLETYYGFMGWDPETGHPTPARLAELGLAWTLPEPPPLEDPLPRSA